MYEPKRVIKQDAYCTRCNTACACVYTRKPADAYAAEPARLCSPCAGTTCMFCEYKKQWKGWYDK